MASRGGGAVRVSARRGFGPQLFSLMTQGPSNKAMAGLRGLSPRMIEERPAAAVLPPRTQSVAQLVALSR